MLGPQGLKVSASFRQPGSSFLCSLAHAGKCPCCVWGSRLDFSKSEPAFLLKTLHVCPGQYPSSLHPCSSYKAPLLSSQTPQAALCNLLASF